MSKVTLNQKVKIKKGARVFYKLGPNAVKFKNGNWIISQVSKETYEKTKTGTYTQKVFFDGEVTVTDPEVIFGQEWVFCKVNIGDRTCHVLVDDIVSTNENEQNLPPAKEWKF